MARTNAISILAGTSTPATLAEIYGLVVENVQKRMLSPELKSNAYTGNPAAGSVEFKRFANAAAKTYGTARTAGKGDAITAPGVPVNLDQHKEIVEEIRGNVTEEGTPIRAAELNDMQDYVADQAGFAENSKTAAAVSAEAAASAAAAADAHKMKLIRRITTTEAVSSVVISTDENGNALSLDKFCLILTLPSAVSVSAGGMSILCNGTSSSHYAYYHTDTANVKHARFEGECMGDTTGADGTVRHWAINVALGNAQGYGNTLKTERYMTAVPTINKGTFKQGFYDCFHTAQISFFSHGYSFLK